MLWMFTITEFKSLTIFYSNLAPNQDIFRIHITLPLTGSSDQVYVIDYDGRGIIVFSEDGHFIKKINNIVANHLPFVLL